MAEHYPDQDEKVLEVNNLRIEFFNDEGRLNPAVHGISFNLYKGETLGIVGESGSGKSVTSLSMLRLIDPQAGRITGGEMIFHSRNFGPVDLLSLTPSQMRRIRGEEIAMIFQDPMSSLNPVYTCGDQVVEAIMLHQKVSYKQARKQTLDLFAEVQLGDTEKIFTSFPHQLSGGQKQRVMIAMALSCKPSILICDEPTTALDVTIQASILDLVKRLKDEKGTSVIFITHDLNLIGEIADRVIVMYRGNIMEQGEVFNIFNSPQHPYTNGLVSCRPRIDRKMKTLPVVEDFIQKDDQGNILPGKDNGRMSSVGMALMLNTLFEEEIDQRMQSLISQPPVLEVRNLKVHYPKKTGWFFNKKIEYTKAVDDVSFVVHPGETLGIVGESGCGKTTLGRSLLRLIEPTDGDIVFQGRNVRMLSQAQMKKLRQKMQIIFQDPMSSLNPRKKVGEAIMEPMKVHQIYPTDRQCREETMNLLRMVGLNEEFFYRYPHQFSGGQRQRIVIARALALKPEFIICDESVSALDVSIQAQVLNLLNSLRESYYKNLSYVFISHDLGVVRFIADRVMVMQQGRIEELKSTEDIFGGKAESPFTKKLLSSIPKGDIETIRMHAMARKMAKKKKATHE